MEVTSVNNYTFSKHLSSKINAIESSLHQTIHNFKDLITEINQMHMQTENVRKQIIAQNEKCLSKCCSGSEELKNLVQSKENIIQLVASALTKLNDTKDFGVLGEVFKILFGESTLIDNVEVKKEINSDSMNIQEVLSPKKEPSDAMAEGQEESVCEIEGTPTGRQSPIIQSKKLRSSTPNGTVSREKKKCPENWLTPEKKSLKLTPSTPTRTSSTRLKQKRLNVVKLKPSVTVDLSTSLLISGKMNPQQECILNNIKQEIVENDDTILPSPTSSQIFPPVYKAASKESPPKFKKPSLSLKRTKTMDTHEMTYSKEHSPDNSVRDASGMLVHAQMHHDYDKGSISENKPPVEANESLSLLQQVKIKVNNNNNGRKCNSPGKLPLTENVNFGNVECNTESSMSILKRDVKIEPFDGQIKRTKSELLEPLYKEPTVRKKAEKRALPGWSCDECKNFYGELYRDNPDMLEKKMNECSKHRGKVNPVRPKTPPGFWNPRWEVPEDTEEFNRRNNAV